MLPKPRPSVGEHWFIRLKDKDLAAGLTRVYVLDYHGNGVWTLRGEGHSYTVPPSWDAVDGTDFVFVHPVRAAETQEAKHES